MSDPIINATEKLALEALNTFATLILGKFKEALLVNDILFDDLVLKVNASNMPSGTTTTAYYNNVPILEWTSPVVYNDGETLTFKWSVKQLSDSEH